MTSEALLPPRGVAEMRAVYLLFAITVAAAAIVAFATGAASEIGAVILIAAAAYFFHESRQGNPRP